MHSAIRQTPSLAQRTAAETIGTLFLVTAVVGSGVMAERLSGTNVGQALLANALATGASLLALISTFGAISGAHFNPVVTLVAAASRELRRRDALVYVAGQLSGAIVGVICANVMFGESPVALSQHARSGSGQFLGEMVASFGLMGTIIGCARTRPSVLPMAVACYIVGAYWFTVSTSFANPAVTLARSMTDTFTGIRPQDVPAFIVAQVLGGLAAAAVFSWIVPAIRSEQTILAELE